MRYEDYNPIARWIKDYERDDPDGVGLEKLCVAAKLKYPTLTNVYSRPKISYHTYRSLKEFIPEEVDHKYREWLEKYEAKQRTKRKKPTRRNAEAQREGT